MDERAHIGVHYGSVMGGGAPHIVRDQIGYLLDAGYRVTFITNHNTDVSGLNQKDLGIARLEQSFPKKRQGFLRRSLSLRRELLALELDVLISHSVRHGTRFGLLTLMSPVHQIIVDHAHPPTTLSLISKEQRMTLKWLLGGTRLLCVSKGAAQAMSELLGRQVGHVYNYAPDEYLAAKYRNLPRARTVVALGRFEKEKQFDVLIDAFENISDDHPDWSLHLYGAGSQRDLLNQKVRESTCANRIRLLGWDDNPLAIMGEAGIVAQTSRYEGFGLTMIEAMSVGAPVISLDCPFGPSEIIHNGQNGVLVPPQSKEAFSRALADLIARPDLRQRIGLSATKVTGRFSKSAHIAAWCREIDGMIGQGIRHRAPS